jgi:dTDP-glucose pyrophosphorylase/predicted transcriptional regulator
MKNWRDVVVDRTTAIREVMRRINESSSQLAMVVDDEGRLVGTVSDGDIRRGLLDGRSIDDAVQLVMNTNPTTVTVDDDRSSVLALMQARDIRHVPLVDAERRVVGLVLLAELLRAEPHENVVVIMAGGIGERLRPLTERVPKPMLHVGGRPILETILLQFRKQGFYNFVFSVNYKAEVIEERFGDGSRWGAQITYAREPKRLGTAGSLRLLPNRPSLPFIVMNGDILTRVDMHALLAFHEKSKSLATMCVREHEYQVPFGVVRTEGTEIVAFEEKPVARWPVNAGIYALDPSAIDLVPNDSFFDMPALFDAARARGDRTSAYTIREYWLDIGRPADFERANVEFAGHDHEEPQ